MDRLRTGEQVWVITELADGLELRHEATLNSTTADGQDNVILFMPSGAQLVLESDEVRTNEGHDWYNVHYVPEDESVDMIGWANSEFLGVGADAAPFLIPVTGGGDGGPTEAIEVHYDGKPKYQVAYLPSNPGTIPQGLVIYKVGGHTKQTSLDEWNAAAGRYYKIT